MEERVNIRLFVSLTLVSQKWWVFMVNKENLVSLRILVSSKRWVLCLIRKIKRDLILSIKLFNYYISKSPTNIKKD